MNFHKYRDVNLDLRGGVRMEGWISLRKGKTIGGIVDLSTGMPLPGTGVEVVTGEIGPFHNIITNLGLNKIADTIFTTCTAYCHCGTGTATEAATDTALGTFLASTNTYQSSANSAQSTAPYYGKFVRTYRFGAGVAEGNVSEIGFSSQSGTGELFSRARVKDGGGSETTITVQSDEWLDVTYEFRLYPDHILANGSADDGTGSVSYSAVSYDYTIRPARITNVTYWAGSSCRAQFGSPAGSTVAHGVAYGTGATLGAATAEPTAGSSDNIQNTDGSSTSASSYSNGTYARNITLSIGLGDGNTSGGIKALMFYTQMGAYQISFNPIVPKDNTKVWNFITNLAWSRATIP